jgi:hypothetical protein
MNQVARMWKGGLTLRIKEIISRVVFTILLEILLTAVLLRNIYAAKFGNQDINVSRHFDFCPKFRWLLVEAL